jgi:pimeloyl-ACP methyl ester carboxylesterase
VSIRLSAACLRRIDPRVLEPIVDAKWLVNYDVTAISKNITAPVLVLQADQAAGGMLTDEDASRLCREIDDCTLIKFPGTGHLIHWTQREALLQRVFGFIESVL